MANKYVNTGDMNTLVIVEDVIRIPDGSGYIVETWQNVFGDTRHGGGAAVWCAWRQTKSNDIVIDGRYQSVDHARLTFWPTDKITPTCRIRRVSDKPKNPIAADDTSKWRWWYVTGAPPDNPGRGKMDIYVVDRKEGM